jgi:hypothetical protein
LTGKLQDTRLQTVRMAIQKSSCLIILVITVNKLILLQNNAFRTSEMGGLGAAAIIPFLTIYSRSIR